jgi:hypothetical protein
MAFYSNVFEHSLARASHGAEKPFQAVIPSGARNLALSVFKTMRDSSSPAAPRNDTPNEFFRSLLQPVRVSSTAKPYPARERAGSSR